MPLKSKINPKNTVCAMILFALIALIGNGCKTLKVNRIIYNEEKQYYEYPVAANQVVPLRNNHGELVSRNNYNFFLVELELMKYRYPFDKRLEQANLLKESDYEIAAIYAEAAQAIKDGQFELAANKIDTIRTIYPDALKFSDGAFIEGYAYERMGKEQEAHLKFNEFINYSSRKYPERFRGYKYADNKDSMLIQQRIYATGFLTGNKQNSEGTFFEPIVPKYYYNNLQPGFNFNDEGLKENSKGIYFLTVGTNFTNTFALGVQYYRNINKLFDINPGYFTSGDMRAISMAVPIQVYKTENNRFGLKFSPFARYSNFRKINVFGISQDMDESVFNFGFKASAGYYFLQNLSLGAYYSYNYYNKSNPYILKSQPYNLWWNNEYDVSLYYNITKGFSLKSGIKAGDVVAGIYWNGWEISYGLGLSNLVLRTDLY